MLSVLFGIAFNSWKQMVRDRIFYVVLLMACLMLGFFVSFGYANDR
jgi:hypothetical protein